MIEVTIERADGTRIKKVYSSIDEWRQDVEKEKAQGISRLGVPMDPVTPAKQASNSFWGKFNDPARDRPRAASKPQPKPKPSRLSTAGLDNAGAAAALNKKFNKLSKKRSG